ncbi:MAG: hypothetical protein V3V32_04460 [Dehalococcoidia bacterium]
MAFTYDVTTDRGRVRLLIPDRKAGVYLTDYLFEDIEIDAFLNVEAGSIKRGAAMGLEIIASDNAMVLKVIRLLDLTTDGAKTSDALLARAKLLRKQADDEEVVGAFDIAEQVVDDFTYRERLRKEALRSG